MDILLGLQWGDEGKGKVVDYLAPKYELVARFQGGPNAGHTLEFEGEKYVLHQIPSGIFQPQATNLIGNGLVLDLITLTQEIEGLEKQGHDVRSSLLISKKATLILPTHRLLDAAYEEAKGDLKIGSTLKGIGPTYQDKIGRNALRTGDLFASDFEKRYNAVKKRHEDILKQMGYQYELAPLETQFWEAVSFIKKLRFVDSTYYLNDQLNAGKSVLAEGAQGTMLDIDFGSYPYVTSSNTCTAGACTGLGVAPNRLGKVYGIFKAYCTRVGSGPFPTELHDETGEKLRKVGNEFGATTGRPRRCGWLDLPALKYAIMINGTTELFMMKADVLNAFEEIKICTHYKLADGTLTEQLPHDLESEPFEPVYKVFEGWHCEVNHKLPFEQLPEALRSYIDFIEQATGVPISLISLGPDRKQTILR